MRISDWSSDVCSSDLTAARRCWPARSGSRPNGCASAATTRECLRLFTVRRQIQTVHPSTSNVSSGCNPRRAERGCHHHTIKLPQAHGEWELDTDVFLAIELAVSGVGLGGPGRPDERGEGRK